MGLITNVAIIAVIVIIVAVVAFVALPKASTTKLTALGAENLVVSDIKTQNPNANVTVISISNSTLTANSWQITLSVVFNASKPCPTVLIEQFDYPATGLHPTNDTQASSFSAGKCSIDVYESLPPYAPLFIASSYASNNYTINSYVSTFGYGNTFVTAELDGMGGALAPNQTITNATSEINGPNDWIVRYKATDANYSLYSILGPSGTVLQTYNAS